MTTTECPALAACLICCHYMSEDPIVLVTAALNYGADPADRPDLDCDCGP